MDTLRIILIVGGLLLVLGIYLWDRIKSRQTDEEEWQDSEFEHDGSRVDPLIGNDNPFDEGWQGDAIQAQRDNFDIDDSLDGLKGIVARHSDDAESEQDDATQAAEHEQPEEEFIILSLMADEGTTFNGMQLLSAMEMCGLVHGEMNIFHYLDLDSGKHLFSVANVLEPGSFDMEKMGEVETPGLAMFMRLPAPIDGEKALLTFVQQAKRLKEQLSGKLTDSQRRELTRETLDDLKNTARRFRVTAE